jgi:glutathione synthase/RimK-type ligase-like ATP-grasp enzyme
MRAGAARASAGIYRSWGPGINLADVRSAWYRRPSDFVIPPYRRTQTTQFARGELTAALSGALRSLDCFWMNHPAAIAEASYKAEQLVRAAKHGIAIPETCITSQPADARGFVRAHEGRVIIKTLGDPSVYSPGEGSGLVGMIFTSTVSADALSKFDRVKDAPVLLQEQIQKQCDIRVTIVQDSIFAVAIDSQRDPASAVDWRQVGPALPHEVVRLPDELERGLLRMTRSYGLSFACIDLVLSEDNEYVFLELNPIGEWGWLERVADVNITDCIVTALLTGDASQQQLTLAAGVAQGAIMP